MDCHIVCGRNLFVKNLWDVLKLVPAANTTTNKSFFGMKFKQVDFTNGSTNDDSKDLVRVLLEAVHPVVR